jgi:hypothetical protein
MGFKLRILEKGQMKMPSSLKEWAIAVVLAIVAGNAVWQVYGMFQPSELTSKFGKMADEADASLKKVEEAKKRAEEGEREAKARQEAETKALAATCENAKRVKESDPRYRDAELSAECQTYFAAISAKPRLTPEEQEKAVKDVSQATETMKLEIARANEKAEEEYQRRRLCIAEQELMNRSPDDDKTHVSAECEAFFKEKPELRPEPFVPPEIPPTTP